MNNTAQYLHNIESQLSKFLADDKAIANDKLADFLNTIKFDLFMQNDLNDINRLLGENFIENHDLMFVNKKILKDIKIRYKKLLDIKNLDDKASNDLLKDINRLTQKSLFSWLNSYPRLTKQIAQRLKKEIYEFEIKGDTEILIPNKYKPFIKSLVHMFRNSVDHGIEMPEQRLQMGKDEIGTISCCFGHKNNMLQIIISDDGAGINAEKIKNKISKEVDISNLTNKEIYLYIFKDNMSTKDEITEISGRGVGMSVVKAELEKLNGTIKIKSDFNVGTTFTFNMPLLEE